MSDIDDEACRKVFFCVELADLADHLNPFDGAEWDCDPIDPDDVHSALAQGRFQTESWQAVNKRHRSQAFDDHSYHIERIAYLMVFRDPTPLDVEIESIIGMERLRMYDGNHRLAAAILSGDVTVRLGIDDWAVEKFLAIIPNAVGTASEDASSAPAL